jgi:phage protein D
MPVADLLNPQVAEFDIVIDGRRLPSRMRPFIASILVDDSLALPSMFALEVVSSNDLEDVNQWIDDDLFAVGNVVEIKLGYGDDLEALIIGEITGLEPEYVSDRLPNLIVRGYDRRHRLQRGRRTRTFVKQKDSDIASKIAGEAGLSAQIMDSHVIHDYVIQANQTDLEFLQERARLIQYETVVYDKQLTFRPIQNNKGEALTIALDDHLLEFYPRLSMARQVSEVSVRGWDTKEKKEILSTAQAGTESSKMGGRESGSKIAQRAFGSMVDVVSTHPLMNQAEADQIAKAALDHRALSLILGEGLCLGRTDLRPGTVIKIDGVGKRFGGQYYVTTASHRYTAQHGYLTQFEARRNAS